MPLSMDVGVGTHDFSPWHFDEISVLMAVKASAQSGSQSAGPSIRNDLSWH